MSDKERKAKDDYEERIKESMVVTERDNMDKKQDAERFLARFERLKGYRDENKKVSIAFNNLLISKILRFSLYILV